MLVVVGWWSMDLDVIFSYVILYTTLTVMNRSEAFPLKKCKVIYMVGLWARWKEAFILQ